MEGRKEGREEGRAEGRAEGMEKKARDTAKNLINMGLSLEQVAQGTELSLKVIQEVAEEMRLSVKSAEIPLDFQSAHDRLSTSVRKIRI
jgi:predicted transposase YdaD